MPSSSLPGGIPKALPSFTIVPRRGSRFARSRRLTSDMFRSQRCQASLERGSASCARNVGWRRRSRGHPRGRCSPDSAKKPFGQKPHLISSGPWLVAQGTLGACRNRNRSMTARQGEPSSGGARPHPERGCRPPSSRAAGRPAPATTLPLSTSRPACLSVPAAASRLSNSGLR